MMPDWWVDGAHLTTDGRKIRCPGEPCMARVKVHFGNKKCSNGGLCSDCCQKYQDKGFLACDYSPHNYNRKLEKVRAHPNVRIH